MTEEKLKTLKDLKVHGPSEWVRMEDLKQEAIKHIKELKREWNAVEDTNYDAESKMILLRTIEGKDEAFRHFFNISSEDLKDE